MLTLWGARQRFCDGLSRRGFLKIGALGASLTLADLYRAQGQAAGQAGSTTKPTTKKSAILIYLPGGPSHMDMYDLKPEAPVEFRGEFKPIATNVAGVQICEHFPLQAAMWDKFACIRSIVAVDEHSDSAVMTGYSQNANRTAGHPSFGSVISKLRSGDSVNAVPPFVSLRGMATGTEPGYLGIAHRPFTSEGPGIKNLRPASGVDETRIDQRKALLEGFDDVRRDLDASGTMTGLDSFTTRAFEMVTSGSVRKALDLSKEDAKVRERYKGVEQFLTARRLVEAGVGCVTLSIGGWDTHGKNFETLKKQLPMVDRGVANLVQDLHDLGMANDVVTLMWGEFGRTPKVNMNAGRDHWAPVMSAMIAGGGLKMGQAVGASTARGERPKDRPLNPQNVLATVYRTLGIDPAMTFPNGAGRPMYLLDDREPVSELI
jgi:hypothetical protein